VAAVTVAAPEVSTTLSWAVFGSKPVPVMISVLAFAASVEVLDVTLGGDTASTVATWTGAPEETPSLMTTAVNDPAVGRLSN
jgi:hypothetical protein